MGIAIGAAIEAAKGAAKEVAKDVSKKEISKPIEEKTDISDIKMPDIGKVNEPKIDKASEIFDKFIGLDDESIETDSDSLKEKAFDVEAANRVFDQFIDADVEELADDEEEIEDLLIDEVKDYYFSSYVERLSQIPKDDGERGEWEGERGESKFIPNDPEIINILKKYGLDGILYDNGIPDFSEVSESTVEIDNMTDNRYQNFKQCDEKCAEQWNKEARDGKNDWTARDVKQWRTENNYTWHERNDMKTCDLVPTKVNDYFGHVGGVSECKKRDSKDDGGEFDE